MARNHSSFFRILSVLGVLVLQFGLCAGSPAQMGSVGSVNVLVLDSSGATVQGANLVLQDRATNETRSVETQGAGTATFASVPLGSYKLTVTKTGFQTDVIDTVIVQGGRVTDVKIELKVGAATERVVVESATPLVETTSNAIASTIDMKQIQDLPLQGRNISNLAFLTPGFSGTGGSGTWNGLPLIAQGNTIDGVVSSSSRMKFEGNTTPGLQARLEDIEEMTVQTEQVDLSQGMGMASMQVNFVTRRGSNDFHGHIFEDFRNRDLNANSWTNNATGRPRNAFIRNEFGGTLGGPIIKDKLFFFGSFSMEKQPGAFTENRANAFLSPLAQQGIYTYKQTGPHGEAPGTTVNLFTQVAGPAGQPVCGGSSDPCAAFLAQIALINKAVTTPGTIVTPTNDPNVESVSWLINSPVTRYFPAFRVDYNATRKVRLDFSFEDTKFSQPNAVAPLYPGPDFANQAASNTANNYIGSFGVNWTVTPTLVNQFRAGYYYNAYWDAQGSQPTWTQLPQIGWRLGNSGESFNLPQPAFYPVVNVSDRASWQHNAHSINFGFDFYREQDHYWNPPDGIPNVGLGLALGDPARQAFDNYFGTAGDAGEARNLYAAIIGRVSSIGPVGSGFPYDQKTQQYLTGQHGPTYNLDELQKGWGLYAQDSFRVTPHFTFNYGLRWDFTGDDHDLTAAYHGAGPEQIYGPSGVGNLFKPGTLAGNMNPAYVAASHQYNPFNVTPQPIIGFAWNPGYSQGLLGKLFNGNTVIRTGFDIKRFTEPYQYFWDSATNHALAYFQGFSLTPGSGTGAGVFAPGSLNLPASADDQHLDAALAGAGLSYALTPPAYQASLPESGFTWVRPFWGASGFDPHINEPYVEEWNLGIQRRLGSSNVLEVRYVGHRAVHQWIATDPNEVNIFENGFLKEFQNAQSNLNICLSNPGACLATEQALGIAPATAKSPIPDFGNLGLAGQVPLPIFDTAFKSEAGGPGTFKDYTNATFRNDLLQGAAGALATVLANPFGNAPYICNLVGSSLSPCTKAQFGGFTTTGAYPLNFFQANPYADGTSPGSALANVGYMQAAGYGTYHALQVDFRQKQWHGMQFDVNYTWSHTLGIQPEFNVGSAAAWTGLVNEFSIRDLSRSYGPTVFDLRHVIHGSGTFDLPFGKGKALLNRSGAVDRVVGGWTLGTIFTYETGFPVQLLGGYGTFNDYGDGGLVLNGVTASQLQNAVGVFQPTATQCKPGVPCTFKDTINPAVFGKGSGTCNTQLAGVCQNTTAGVFGSNPWLYGPHLWNDDMSLSKVVPFNERVKFTLQAEFLNIFNHPNWANPDGTITDPGFGTAGLSNFNGARQIELRANITF